MSTGRDPSASHRSLEGVWVAVRRHTEALRNYIFRKSRNPQEIDDLSQEVWKRLLQMDPRKIRDPVATLFAQANWVIADHGRELSKAGRHFSEATDSDQDVPSKELPVEELLAIRQQLGKILRSVHPKYAKVLLLYHRDKYSIKEIARLLELQPDTVKKYLTRARVQIRMKFRRMPP